MITFLGREMFERFECMLVYVVLLLKKYPNFIANT